MLVSITRLRLRSVWFLIPFIYHTTRSQKQAQTAAGCLGVNVRKTKGLAFWTLTVWDSETNLRAFLAQGPHRVAMPKLFHWCDEAATAHWAVESAALPDWESATQRLLQQGRLSKLKYPSAAQSSGRIEVS